MTAARSLLRTAVAGLALGGIAIGAAPPAVAAPGDNGDIKIHSVGTPPLDQRNEPKVCRFYLAAFNFDTLQQVSYTIVPQPMRAGDPSLSGGITLATGTGHTEELSLPDGMYKLTWTFEGASGAGKMKVFRVDCPGGGNGNGNGVNGNGPNGNGHKGPHGGVGAGGGGMAESSDGTSAFGVGAALAAGLAGTAGLILVRRRRRADGAA
ncbi:hypothetical protein [Streptomyces sp. TRM64462]|uniref:hypothetical protein n=1 Tax=Streptomyces sp. TRM64462 TaxID=2741726 RepID=UPI0015865923|nr:hypothetical protein [Streptomyces sp. TRM64462]